jgi:hypothetical protein
METAILKSRSKADMETLIKIARKFGIVIRLLSEEEQEDMGLLAAMRQGKTGRYVDTKSFIKKLRK